MSRKSDSLKHQLRKKALEQANDNETVKAYRRSCDAFAEWAKGEGIKQLSEITKDVLQAYEQHLEKRPEGYSASTIHSKLAGVCKATGVSMKEISKPKRTAKTIKRGRSETKTGRAEKELADPKYARLTDLQKAVGIRRSELEKLTGADLIRDENGNAAYIRVERGKGGKEQLQWILPKDRETVEGIFSDVKPDGKVFSGEEMANHINLHKMRAEHAKDVYDYFAKLIKDHPSKANSLRDVLLKRWEKGHRDLLNENPKRYEHARRKFLSDMDDRPYKLRGENLQKAKDLGLPEEYDRLAVMAASVFALSHWRLDVTMTNYLLQ